MSKNDDRDKQVEATKLEMAQALSKWLEPDVDGIAVVALIGLFADITVKHLKLVRRHEDPTQPLTFEDYVPDIEEGIEKMCSLAQIKAIQELRRSFQ